MSLFVVEFFFWYYLKLIMVPNPHIAKLDCGYKIQNVTGPSFQTKPEFYTLCVLSHAICVINMIKHGYYCSFMIMIQLEGL